jgi:integrase
MRENEICQLNCSDVKATSKGTWYIEVAGDDETKRVKNTRSERRIPVHSELIKAGFLDFVAEQAAFRPGGKLFKELTRSRHGYYGENFSKWANRTFLKAAGVKTPKKNVHSFRHTVKDALERAETPIHVIDAIGGWNTVIRGASVNYGNGPTVDDLAPYVERIKYPGLDLSHLYSHSPSSNGLKTPH